MFIEFLHDRSIGDSCIGPRDLNTARDLSKDNVSDEELLSTDIDLLSVGEGEGELEESDKTAGELSGGGGLSGRKGRRGKFGGGGW